MWHGSVGLIEENNIEFLSMKRTFYSYAGESSLAQFYQLVGSQPTPSDVQRVPENMQSAFSQLPEAMRNAIFGCVWVEAGSPQTGDSQWGGTHAFDDMRIFCRALHRYVRDLYNSLNVGQRNAVFGHVYDLARREPGAESFNFDIHNWGELNARVHILRLIDAMMRELQR
jgi:hypothetical protein